MKNMTQFLFASTAIVAPAAFENDGGGWKKDAEGKLELDADGNPIYVNTAGKEQSVKGDTIASLNREAQTHREDKEAAEKALLPYKDIDPVKAKEAIDKMATVDLSKMVEAGKVDEVRDQITEQFTGRLNEKDAALNAAIAENDSLKLDRAFDQSKFLADKVVLPDYVRMKFGQNFKVEDGRVVPYTADGKRMTSPNSMGDFATVDEAIEVFVDLDPNKDKYMRADNQGGSGNGGEGGNRGNGKVMRRADFDQLDPQKQSAIATDGETQIVD